MTGEAGAPSLLVVWTAVVPLPLEWEESFLDARDRARRRGYAVHVTDGEDGVGLRVIAYLASQHEDTVVRDTVAQVWDEDGKPSASRIGIVACGRSSPTLTEQQVRELLPEVATGAAVQCIRALTLDELRDHVERLMIVSVRRVADVPIDPRPQDYTAEGLIERNDAREEGELWLRTL